MRPQHFEHDRTPTSFATPVHTVEVCYAFSACCEPLRDDPHLLAVVRFGDRTWSDSDGTQAFGVGMPILGRNRDIAEVWRSAEPVTQHCDEEVVLRGNGHCAFGHVLVREAEHGDIETATRFAYERMLRTLHRYGYEHMVRVWNYFPAINQAEAGRERYQGFCIGRHAALSAAPDFEHHLPAATAIGTCAPGLLIYFLAARQPGSQVENPRQVSAFHYPSQYGPRSPSFSRAVHKDWEQGASFYISGTASVVGHASRHRQDLRAQIEETVRNLDALAGAAQAQQRGLRFPQDLAALKVYLRHEHDQAQAAGLLRSLLGADVPTLYLRGDICRSDLLMELEAVVNARP